MHVDDKISNSNGSSSHITLDLYLIDNVAGALISSSCAHQHPGSLTALRPVSFYLASRGRHGLHRVCPAGGRRLGTDFKTHPVLQPVEKDDRNARTRRRSGILRKDSAVLVGLIAKPASSGQGHSHAQSRGVSRVEL
jgi:hypothetical protein